MLFMERFIDENHVYAFLNTFMNEEGTHDNDIEFTTEQDTRIDQYRHQLISTHKKTLYVTQKEATSLVVHGGFFYLLSEVLEKKLQTEVYVDYQLAVCATGRPGNDFLSDVGLVVAVGGRW